MSMEHWWHNIDKGNWSTWRKTYLTTTVSTTNLLWTGQGLNWDPLNHVTAINLSY